MHRASPHCLKFGERKREREGGLEGEGRVGVGECEQTDRHAFLLAGLGFRNLLDGPGIDGSQAIFLSLNFLLADGCRRPV